MPRTAALLAFPVAGLLLAGCASGAPSSAATAGATPAAASPSGAALAIATPPPAGGGGGGGGGSTRASATPRTSGASPAASAPAGLPEITSFNATPACKSTTGTAQVTLSWTSKNATEAWISNPIVASAAGDPRTTAGASGPLPPNGSTTMSFDCSSMYNYYDLGVYGGGHSSGEIKQVPRNV